MSHFLFVVVHLCYFGWREVIFDQPSFVSHSSDFFFRWFGVGGGPLHGRGRPSGRAAQLTIVFVSSDRPAPWFCPSAYGYCWWPTFSLVALDSWLVLQPPASPSLEHLLHLMWSYCCLHCVPTRSSSSPGMLRRGCSLSFKSVSIGCIHSGNHSSAIQHLAVVWEHVQTEVIRSSLVGPLPPSAAERVQVSALGLVPKPQSNKWRLIVNLSAPAGASVNDGICPERCSLSYASFDDAVAVIQHLGRGAELFKMDLKDAYCVVPVHPQDHLLLGIRCDCGVYVDRSLPFGLWSAPLIFTAFTDLVAWAIYHHGVQWLLHYFDDFLFFGLWGLQKCPLLLRRLEGCCWRWYPCGFS